MGTNLREQAMNLADRPYAIEVLPDETTDGQPAFIARVVDLPGCLGSGLTEPDAIQDARLAMVDFIESLLEDDMPVPVPFALLPVSHSTGSPSTPVHHVIRASSLPPHQETLRPKDVHTVVA